MSEMYCGKDCQTCAYREATECRGCLSQRQYCEIAHCCRSKGHESCETCSFRNGCGKLMEKENVPHLLFYVDIQHKTKSGRIHHEMYTVNAWHNVALRASEKLRNGQYVMLRGYLTQRPVRAGDMSYMLTELTVKDFVSSHQMHIKTDVPAEHETREETVPAGVSGNTESAAE